jgi:predicted DNA-binding transcriptional regulator AlpA
MDKQMSGEMPEKRIAYQVAEAAYIIGVSRSWLYRLWAEKAGPPRVVIQGRVLILAADLDQWLASHSNGQSPQVAADAAE